ncbi:4'-phosphopantetheinyl transferase superfamily protein [Yinghuangia sp. ASG 101]|nr:4'-phosphopantetheinyl transferase superfamily protein [Yinghuangia sp. ASG 101]UGQ12906.1 4'-phosphopantetheinyl transferase superfamily protein [Yinghuangia sp. ASG 101]
MTGDALDGGAAEALREPPPASGTPAATPPDTGRATLLALILPASVATEECFDDPPGTALFPEEEACVARAVDKRRREFTTVRRCARLALGRLGVAPVPLVPGERGAPSWPADVVGSMTHCAGYRAAAVAPAARIRTIGIDAEPAEELPEGVLDSIASPDERRHLAALSVSRPEVPWERLLFSAKESVYKAWFPLTRRWLGFEEAEVGFDVAAGASTGTFAARILAPDAPVEMFTGRWILASGIVATAIAVPRAD